VVRLQNARCWLIPNALAKRALLAAIRGQCIFM